MKLSVNLNSILSFHAPEVSDLTWNLVPKYGRPQGSLSGGLVLRNMYSPCQWLTMQGGKWKWCGSIPQLFQNLRLNGGKEESLDALEDWP